jgi:hypothetical protein
MIREETVVSMVRPNANIDHKLSQPPMSKLLPRSEQCMRQVLLKSYIQLDVLLYHICPGSLKAAA